MALRLRCAAVVLSYWVVCSCRWRTGDGAIGVRMASFCGVVCRAKCAVLERKRFFILSIGVFLLLNWVSFWHDFYNR